MPSKHLILCRPLLLLPSIFPSIRVFSNESGLHIKWPKNWSFSFSIGLSNEYSGLISFRMDWLDLHAVQGTLKSLLQHHSSKASILQCSVFFIGQLSHLYMTSGKAKALTIRTFVGKVLSLLFNMLSRLVITFLPRNKRLLISWLQAPSAVILEPPKIKSVTISIVSPSICHEVMGPDVMILVFWMLSFKSTFSLSSFTFIKRLFFAFCHKCGTVCVSEVIDISPGNLDSSLGFPCGSAGIESACNGFNPWVWKIPGRGKGYPLQYHGLENSMDSIAHGVAELDTTEQLIIIIFKKSYVNIRNNVKNYG